MKHKKVIILSITVGVLLILLVGIGLVFWNINSYTAGNWLVESRVREYIGNAYPDLDYEIVSRDIYETEEDGDRVLIVWEFDIKCEDEMHTLYFTSNQTREREPLFFNVADYAQIRFDCEGNTRTTAVFFHKISKINGL